jgi:hypothetical protein
VNFKTKNTMKKYLLVVFILIAIIFEGHTQNCNCSTANCTKTIKYQDGFLKNKTINCNNPTTVGIESNTNYQFFSTTNCTDATCDMITKGEFRNSDGDLVIQQTPFNSNTNSFNIISSTPGNYTFIIKYYINGVECSSCTIPIIVKGPLTSPPGSSLGNGAFKIDSCSSSNWEIEPTITTTSGLLVQNLNLSNPQLITISQAQNLCNLDLKIKGKFSCDNSISNNTPKVVYTITNNATTASFTGTNTITIPKNLANGQYTLKIEAYCGGTVCKTYNFQIKKNCPQNTPCCQNSSWGAKSIAVNGVFTPLPATESNIGFFHCNENKKFKVCFNCGGDCGPAQIKYEIYKYGTLILLSTTTVASCTLANITMPSMVGDYQINISTICNGEKCQALSYYFSISCP